MAKASKQVEIAEMTRQEILALEVEDIRRLLTPEEIMHIATTLGAFWAYDYKAAEEGRIGMHARLKSDRHSDGFFVSRILLEPENIRQIISHQIVMRLNIRDWANISHPDYVVGVPDGATKLGDEIAGILGIRKAVMEKVKGLIVLVTPIKAGETLLLIEDFCTRGTGFTEAVLEVKKQQPDAQIIPYDPVIINRGGLTEIVVEGVGTFTILPIVEWRVQDWEPVECPLCALGSTPIKPKETEGNWHALITSQS